MEKVSFVAPVFNKAAWIAETIESIQGQTLKEFEAIFIDDGSTDGTPEIIEFFAKSDPRIKLKRLKKNGGLGKAWNIGTKLVKSDVILVASGDDVWSPERAKLSWEALRDGEADVFYGSFWFCDEQMNRKEFKPAIPFSKKKLLTPRKDGFCPQYIGHFVMAYRREIGLAVPMRKNLKVGVDYPFLVDLANYGARFSWTKKVLGEARILRSGVSISRRKEVEEASVI